MLCWTISICLFLRRMWNSMSWVCSLLISQTYNWKNKISSRLPVGFKGPVSLLCTKILLVLLFNGLVLALFALLPHFIGRMGLKVEWLLIDLCLRYLHIRSGRYNRRSLPGIPCSLAMERSLISKPRCSMFFPIRTGQPSMMISSLLAIS